MPLGESTKATATITLSTTLRMFVKSLQLSKSLT